MALSGCKSDYAQMSKNEGKNGFWFDVTLICKQVVIWVNVSLSLVLSGFRNSGDLRLRCYRWMAGMGFPFCRFSDVPSAN